MKERILLLLAEAAVRLVPRRVETRVQARNPVVLRGAPVRVAYNRTQQK